MSATQFADLPAATLLSICDKLGGDGHGLYDPAFLVQEGVPQKLVESVTHTYESGSDYKSTIFKDGNVIAETTAIYSLTLYRAIAGSLGLAHSKMSGRGFEARDLDRRIHEHLAKQQ